MFSILGRMLEGLVQDLEPRRTNTSPRPRPTPGVSVLGPENVGRIVTGRVGKIAPGYVLVMHGDTKVLIPKHELVMGDVRVEDPSGYVSEGDMLECVLLEKSERGWKGSVHAITEAHRRRALASVRAGSRMEARVDRFEASGAWLRAGGLDIWVPLAEICWSWIDHPSEALSFEQQVSVQISDIFLDEKWLTDKRARRSRVTASIKACQAQPAAANVTMYFKAFEFQVRTSARIPRRCDAVALFVLEAVCHGLDLTGIANLTGLPTASVQQIATLLTEEGLLRGDVLSESGRRLLTGLETSRALNESSLGGLFASAAPVDQQVHPLSTTTQQYPRNLPVPVANIRNLTRFLRLRGDALPNWLLGKVQVGDEQRDQLAAMIANPHVRVYLSQTPNWRALALDVPERWLLAGLWRSFEPVGEAPFRPPPKEQGCDAFLMVRYMKGAQALFWEPVTQTLWAPRNGKQTVHQAGTCQDDVLQHMPAGAALRLAQATSPTWCWIQS